MKGLSKIDRFEVLEPLAEGSFGPLHKGRDAATGRQVVIKLCTLPGQGLRQSFFTESKMAVKLRHPHVVEVLAAGWQDDMPYQVQEYLSGEDLTQVIAERRPWRGTDKLSLLLQVAQGLAYAHGQGVAHLDLKPDNVRLSGTVAKVMDFGTSRLASSETRSTQRGVTLATASYLPPEQVRSAPLDQRVDVFAFGALAYELFTYQRPFRGQTLSALVYQILYKEPVPLSSVWPECPTPLEKILTTCLAKDREQRYAGFPPLLSALQDLQGEVEKGVYPALNDAIAARQVSVDPQDVMSQSLITRTAVKVSPPTAPPPTTPPPTGPPQPPRAPTPSPPANGTATPVSGGAVTQRLARLDSAPSPTVPPSEDVVLPAPGGDSATVRIPVLAPPQAGSDRQGDGESDGSEEATVVMSKLPSPTPRRTKVGATTRTSQPVGQGPSADVAHTAVRAATPPRRGTVETQPTTKSGGERTTDPPKTVPSSRPPAPPSAAPAKLAASEELTATTQAPPPATAPPATPTKAASKGAPTPAAAASAPLSETGKLALSAQEISALVAQGKLEEAQRHIEAMQQHTPAKPTGQPAAGPQETASSELPTTVMPATKGRRPAGPPEAGPPQAGPPQAGPPQAGPPQAAPPQAAPPPMASPPATPPPRTPSAAPATPSPAVPSPGVPSPAATTTPGQRDLDRSVAPPAPTSTVAASGNRKWLWSALAVVGLVCLAGVGWWLMGRGEVAPAPAEVAVPRPQSAPPGDAAAALPTGRLQVDASPWGTITEITDGSGYLVELPEQRVTPLFLDLPLGNYRIVVSRGPEAPSVADGETPPAAQTADGSNGEEVQRCEVELVELETAVCRVVFAPPATVDYFKQVGWWQ